MNNQELLIAETNTGRTRKNNEDNVTVLTHHKNEQIKLLAVADGVGGLSHGEVASETAINNIILWFNKLSVKELKDPNIVIKSLNQKLNDINTKIQDIADNVGVMSMGTTLTMAVVLEDETIVANIGDSRTYAVKDKHIEQLTDDDSISFYFYKQGEITKDQIRFDSRNNAIYKYLGMDTCSPIIKTINNTSYDGLLLFTDGVTDLLSDQKISFIANYVPKEQIANILINEAVNVDQNEGLSPGKDNATVAVYIKK